MLQNVHVALCPMSSSHHEGWKIKYQFLKDNEVKTIIVIYLWKVFSNMESCVFQMAQLLAHTSGSGSFSSSNSLGSRGSSVVSIETQVYINKNMWCQCDLGQLRRPQWVHECKVFYGKESKLLACIVKWAVTRDFQQCGIFTSVDRDKPMQPPFKLRNSKWCSVSGVTVIGYSSDHQRLWSDCAYVQADLRLCWSYIPHCWKSHVAVHM